MKALSAPNGGHITKPKRRIFTFGLTDEQNQTVKDNLPAKGYEVMDTDAATDLIAIYAAALIINAGALSDEDREMIYEYYHQIGSCVSETIFWLGNPKPEAKLRAYFRCCRSFDELAPNLKYLLLTAHSKSKKAVDYSKKLADGLRILSLIRRTPGIKTQEIADITEIQPRTVQRYIASLQAAGEWIEYDRSLKGWALQHGVSVLFGDCREDKE